MQHSILTSPSRKKDFDWRFRKDQAVAGRVAFTLIELLVVLGIVAILASLLLPALTRAKRTSESIVCRNNLRQLGIGLTAYLGDYCVYPAYSTTRFSLPDAPGQLLQRFWFYEVEPYLGDKWPADNFAQNRSRPSPGRGVYACPGYNRVRGIYQTFTQGASGAYGYNHGAVLSFPILLESAELYGLGSMYGLGDVHSMPSAHLDDRPVPEGLVVSPSQMIAMGDSEIVNPIGSPPGEIIGSIGTPMWFENLMYNELSRVGTRTPSPRPLLQTDQAMIQRHSGRWNLLFCDGHVEQKRISALISRDDQALSLWSRDHQSHRKGPN